jgi:hypothetical protein
MALMRLRDAGVMQNSLRTLRICSIALVAMPMYATESDSPEGVRMTDPYFAMLRSASRQRDQHPQ